MSLPAASPKILYRNSRLLRMVFLQLHRQQRADLFCDVVLQAEGEAVPAHCCILSACSPFFTERLEREMPQKGHKVVLEIRGLKIGTLRKLVDFLYTSEMEVSREEAQDILAAARQLQVSELESLQLEGGKLVKKSLSRRLNRDCLQLSSPISIANVSLMQSPAACGTSFVTSWLAAEKQCPSYTKEMDNADQNRNKKQKPSAFLGGGKQQMPEGPMHSIECPRTKLKKRSTSLVRNVLDTNRDLHAEKTRPESQPAAALILQNSKKIKLSRPKLSSPSLLMPGASKDHSTAASSEPSSSVKRVWRQKRSPNKNERKAAEDMKYLHGFWSPSPPKAAKCRKRNSSEPALCSKPAQEAGQVSRVRLRKVINGSCWEVVQEPPSMQCIKTENSAYALQEDVPCSQLRCAEPTIADAQQAGSSAECLPIKPSPVHHGEKEPAAEGEGTVTFDEGDPYDLNTFVLDRLSENEQFNNLASAGELEHMLEFFLEDEDAVPEEVRNPCPAAGTSKILQDTAEAKAKDRCSPESCTALQNCQLPVKTANGVEEPAASEISEGALPPARDNPLQDPVLDYMVLGVAEPSSGCLASPQLDRSTDQEQQPVSENGPSRLSEPLLVGLSGDEDRAFLSCGVGTSGAETHLDSQGLLKGPWQQSVDCKVPPLLSSLEEELDVGVEELFGSIECVRPDSSPMSETEVDVLS